MKMLSDDKVMEVKEMLRLGFSRRYISARTGISRPMVSAIAENRRIAGATRRPYKNKIVDTPRDPADVIQQARQALVANGRERGAVR